MTVLLRAAARSAGRAHMPDSSTRAPVPAQTTAATVSASAGARSPAPASKAPKPAQVAGTPVGAGVVAVSGAGGVGEVVRDRLGGNRAGRGGLSAAVRGHRRWGSGDGHRGTGPGLPGMGSRGEHAQQRGPQGRVVVQDPADPSRQIERLRRIIRFRTSGWLTVVASPDEDAEIELYPTSRVLAVTDLREVPGHGPGGSG